VVCGGGEKLWSIYEGISLRLCGGAVVEDVMIYFLRGGGGGDG